MPDTFNAAEIILAQADRLKDKTALIYSDRTMSYGEFAKLVNRAANAFTAAACSLEDKSPTVP